MVTLFEANRYDLSIEISSRLTSSYKFEILGWKSEFIGNAICFRSIRWSVRVCFFFFKKKKIVNFASCKHLMFSSDPINKQNHIWTFNALIRKNTSFSEHVRLVISSEQKVLHVKFNFKLVSLSC